MALVVLFTCGATGQAGAETVLRIGMTAADIPLTYGVPDNGFEGYRFSGYTMYDALVNWDLSSADKPSPLIAGLATGWRLDPKDNTKWYFTLRKNVKFQDGTSFNADAVVFTYDSIINPKAPQFDARRSGLVRFRIPDVVAVKKVNEYEVEITTKGPDAYLPYQVAMVLIVSPTQWEKVGKSWTEFAKHPIGTGPWKLVNLVPRERAELMKFPGYWDAKRVPKTDRLVLLPIPEATTRTSALLSGQVDWIEAPAPDSIPRLKAAGMHIVTNIYPHNWTYHLSFLPGSPWQDIRVRKAVNDSIDRTGLKKLMGGLMLEGQGLVPKSSPWYGHPKFVPTYDPALAKKLLAEAGYGPNHPLKLKIAISASGSGQMQPLAMNEFIQQNLKDVGIDVEFDVTEWQALLDRWRVGADAPANKGISALNVSYATQDPFAAFTRFLDSHRFPPNGNNWGHFSDPRYDAIFKKMEVAFDPKEMNRLTAELHTMIVDDALFIFVAHDLNPRAMSPKVTGFVQAQSWFQDLSPVVMKP